MPVPARDDSWKPPYWDPEDVYALRALRDGTATDVQQVRAFDWIVERACAFREEPYRSDRDGGERETAFALGRHFVARQMMKLLTMPGSAIETVRKKK